MGVAAVARCCHSFVQFPIRGPDQRTPEHDTKKKNRGLKQVRNFSHRLAKVLAKSRLPTPAGVTFGVRKLWDHLKSRSCVFAKDAHPKVVSI